MRVVVLHAFWASLVLGLKIRPGQDAVDECPSMWLEEASSCAMQRGESEQQNIVLASMFKDPAPAELVRQLEYHFLLGVDLAILFDNSCPSESPETKRNADALEEALQPYIWKKTVIFRKDYQCANPTEIFPERNPIGGSSLALQLIVRHKELHPAVDTLMLPIDDDEYVVMADATQNLMDLRSILLNADDPSVALPWRLYGSSGHVCQPTGPTVRNFIKSIKSCARMTESEVEDASKEAKEKHLNPPCSPHSHKFVILWKSAAYISRCNTHNCGIPTDAATRRSWLNFNATWDPHDTPNSPITEHAFLAHYAYQSEQHWAFKARGRGSTDDYGDRLGPVPSRYNEVTNTKAWDDLVARIGIMNNNKLRACLTDMFGPTPAVESPAAHAISTE